MSKVKIQGNASGTGVVTLTAPNTNTDRTITLPDETVSLTGAPAGLDDVSGVARATSGLLFNGDTAAANALDDYEEGTWTPIISISGSTTGILTSNIEGIYTKIGRLVTCHMRVALTSKGTAVGNITVGLPFVVDNIMTTTSVQGSGNIGWHAGITVTNYDTKIYPWEGFSYCHVGYKSTTTGSSDFLTNSNISNNWDFRATVQFISA